MDDRAQHSPLDPRTLAVLTVLEGVANNWHFTPEKYPDLKDAAPEAVAKFAKHHVKDHLMELVGILAGQSERLAHGMTPPELLSPLRIVFDLLLNTAKLAELLGVTPDQLTEALVRYIELKEIPQ
jgi:hypothetical protein